MGTRMETKILFVPGGICSLALVVAGMGSIGNYCKIHLSTNGGVSKDSHYTNKPGTVWEPEHLVK